MVCAKNHSRPVLTPRNHMNIMCVTTGMFVKCAGALALPRHQPPRRPEEDIPGRISVLSDATGGPTCASATRDVRSRSTLTLRLKGSEGLTMPATPSNNQLAGRAVEEMETLRV